MESMSRFVLVHALCSLAPGAAMAQEVETPPAASPQAQRRSDAHLLFGVSDLEGAERALGISSDIGVLPGRSADGGASVGGLGLELRGGAVLGPKAEEGSVFQTHYGLGLVAVPWPGRTLVPYASIGPSLAGSLDLVPGGEADGFAFGVDLFAVVGLDLLPGPHGRVGFTGQIALQQPVVTLLSVNTDPSTVLTAMVGLRLPAKMTDGGRLARWSGKLPSF